MSAGRPLVSIDIFDTAVFRDVYTPKELFLAIENRGYEGFYEARVKAQAEAGKKDFNYTLTDIYKRLPGKYNMKEEILEEIKGCRPNPYILNFYNENKDKYDFIFISDMYLPSKVLKALLENAGYGDPHVFVSCEEGCTKGNGRLFTVVEEKLGKKISKHIGDNYQADINGARKAGISEVEYIGPAVYQRETTVPFLKNPKLRKLLIDKEFCKETSIEEKVGFWFAPLVLAFTKHVLKNSPCDSTIFFNARDSFLMYVTAKYILKTQKKIKYCRFSRRSVQIPNFNTDLPITDNGNKRAYHYFLNARLTSVQDFLDTFELKCIKDIQGILNKYGIGFHTNIFFSQEKQQIFKEILVLLQDEIYEKARAEKQCLFKYLEKLGMKSNDVFVDLGHYGSMQSVLQSITGIKLQGEYVHLYAGYKDFYKDNAKKSSFLPLGFLGAYTGIAELIFTECAGTVINYSEKGIPLLKGNVKYRKDIIKKVLRGVLKGVKEIYEEDLKVFPEDCATILKRFFDRPTLQEAEFANRELFENGSLFANESIVWYNRDEIKRGKLRECYNRSYWKPAFKVLLENDSDYKNLVTEIR